MNLFPMPTVEFGCQPADLGEWCVIGCATIKGEGCHHDYHGVAGSLFLTREKGGVGRVHDVIDMGIHSRQSGSL
jgi:hypothetical protein